jgi:hypothetical protein
MSCCRSTYHSVVIFVILKKNRNCQVQDIADVEHSHYYSDHSLYLPVGDLQFLFGEILQGPTVVYA